MTEVDEDWRVIESYPNYKVSDLGRVFSIKRGKCLKLTETPRGYYRVSLYKNKKLRSVFVHRIVLDIFAKDRHFKGAITRHVNGIKTDNRIDNLKWGTQKENEQDKRAHGTYQDGENSPNKKLTEQDVVDIRKTYKRQCKKLGTTGLAKKYGVHKATILGCVSGQTWPDVEPAKALDYVPHKKRKKNR